MNKTAKLYDITNWNQCNYETEKCPYIGEAVLNDYKFGDVIELNDAYYSTHTANADYIIIGVKKAEIDFAGEEIDYESDVICPYCGYADRDSFELPNDEDEHKCGICKGIFSYQRIVTVEYCSQPVKPPKVVKSE